MANYVGPLKVISIPGTFSPAKCLKQLQEPANDWLMYLVCVLSPNDLHLLNQVASTYTCVTYLSHTIMKL